MERITVTRLDETALNERLPDEMRGLHFCHEIKQDEAGQTEENTE